MDIALRRFHLRILEALRARFPTLSKNPPKLRIPFWGWALPLAFLLAAWAHRNSQAEGRIAWLASNAPSENAWGDLLKRRGFSPIEDPAWKEKAYAEMPEVSRTKASAFISEDHYHLAIRQGSDWIYFRLGGNGTKTDGGQVVARELWEGLGIGWEALSNLEKIELPKIETRPKNDPATVHWSDSREISY